MAIKDAWVRVRTKIEEIERRAKRRREATEAKRAMTARLQEQYLNPHSPMSILPPLDGSNPERHRTRRLGEDQVGPEPGPFWQPGKKPFEPW